MKAPGPFRTLALALAGAAAPAGCSTYQAPRLRVVDVAVADASPEGMVLDFTLDAQNPNEVELPLLLVRYEVSLDGREVFSGIRSPEATLRRLGTQRITIPAAIPLGEGLPTPAGPTRYTIEGELQYVTPGELAQVLFDLGVRRPTVGFRHEGVAELPAR